jgi:hypothetical protein
MELGQIQQSKKQSNDIGYKKYGWKNVAIKVKENDLIALNRQLDRLGYETRRHCRERRRVMCRC